MEPNRRQAMLKALFGVGLVGLRSLATGLPASFLLNPRAALAQTPGRAPQFLIVATSGNGDAVNANAPGTYDLPGTEAIIHPTIDGVIPVVGMEPTAVTLGGATFTAAKPWSTLNPDLKLRTSFFHHATLTANHGDEPRVLKLMGAVRRDEMLTSFIAKSLAPTLGTVQKEPIGLAEEVQQFEGKYQPRLTPLGLKSVLTAPTGLAADLQAIRDRDLDAINAVLKGSRATTRQREFLDQMALSQAQVRKLSDEFASDLSAITNNDAANQALAAPLLVRMRVTPVVTMHLPFSGDNHTDLDWTFETTQTAASVTAMNTLYTQLKKYGMENDATFLVLDVFGRELTTPLEGRGHNPTHNVAVMFGPAIKGGVIGGVSGNSALDIDETTGAGVKGGSVALVDTLATMGKTVAAACGVDETTIDAQITKGVILKAALT